MSDRKERSGRSSRGRNSRCLNLALLDVPGLSKACSLSEGPLLSQNHFHFSFLYFEHVKNFKIEK